MDSKPSSGSKAALISVAIALAPTAAASLNALARNPSASGSPAGEVLPRIRRTPAADPVRGVNVIGWLLLFL
jgi:hypothetical protein